MTVLLIVPAALALILFIIYFLRSSKETPKNWRELVIEFKFQIYGIAGFFEDCLLILRNRVGEISDGHIRLIFAKTFCRSH